MPIRPRGAHADIWTGTTIGPSPIDLLPFEAPC